MAWGLASGRHSSGGSYIYESASGARPYLPPGDALISSRPRTSVTSRPAPIFSTIMWTPRVSTTWDFDWADETYGTRWLLRWLKELLSVRGQDPTAYDQVRDRCEKLVEVVMLKPPQRGRSGRHQESGACFSNRPRPKENKGCRRTRILSPARLGSHDDVSTGCSPGEHRCRSENQDASR